MKIFKFFLIIILIIPIIVKASEKQIVTLNKCIDGDTASFIYNNEIIKVRFLAIDTPESVHPTKEIEKYGKEASEFTCDKLLNSQKIEIEFDENSSKKDKYNRYLAWIWTNDKLLQDELISNGLAKVEYLYGNYKYTDLLQEHQNIAKNEKIGIWSNNEINNNEENNIIFKYILITITFLIMITMLIYSKKFRKKTIKNIEKNLKK